MSLSFMSRRVGHAGIPYTITLPLVAVTGKEKVIWVAGAPIELLVAVHPIPP
jgi:hypothetical protein